MKIYTKRGDGGETSLRQGVRVPKDDIRIETNGQIDELNSLLGIITSMMEDGDEGKTFIQSIQKQLMAIMALIANTKNQETFDLAAIMTLTKKLEIFIDTTSGSTPFTFVIPGGSQMAAFLHYARSKARTCERRMWTLQREYPLNKAVMKFMNRLSDYLFMLAICDR